MCVALRTWLFSNAINRLCEEEKEEEEEEEEEEVQSHRRKVSLFT